MRNQIHRVLLIFFSILTIAFGSLAILVDLYHDGYYIDVKVRYGEGFRIPSGEYTLESPGILPEGFELIVEGDKVMLWGPPPAGTKLNMAWNEHYLFARQVKITMDDLLNPYVDSKYFMKGLDENMGYIGLFFAIGETIFNVVSKKYEKRTVLHVYRIDIITIKILNYVRTLQINNKTLEN